ncbi:glycoside hydrolase family 13 protein [Rhodothermus bifroesti]|uniref:glycoside hydrolase family 13 protein n=1 Tax=Rhodothermus bifroesti TaxID=2823335 RepID=UPI001AF005BC|nr:glycoside hydrolase family 13 protein [Rhodothermus bifroesti]
MRQASFLVALLLVGCAMQAPKEANVPDWAADAIWYQIFPERFWNGDTTNDPTRASLEYPPALPAAPASWRLSPWTGDWYARDDWEREMGEDFYESYAVFHRRYGGDLQGVIDRLDYLKDLGVTALYFNPVFYARSLHKYDGNTFHHIDPYFGPDPEGDLALMAQETEDPSTWHWTAADRLFLRLIQEAHARGMRVIIDGVFNHTGRDFFAFADLRARQQDSPYKDWYIVRRFDDPATPDTNEFDYEGWWGVKTLPVFADNAAGTDLHPGPKRYIFHATARWMDPNGDGDPSDGIDGWRLDVTNEVPVGFWADWNAYVRQLNPNAYTVTELWQDARDIIVQGGFSATMNYFAFAFPVKAFLIDYGLDAPAFARLLDERRSRYPLAVQYAMQNLIDSHDTDRLASMIVNRDPAHIRREQFGYDRHNSPRHNPDYKVQAPDATARAIQRLVALFQMTYVGAPMIYYGTEAGMWGADDPDVRKPMVWPELQYADEVSDPLGRPRQPDPVRFDSTLFQFYQQAIALRKQSPALRRGTFSVLMAEGGLLVFQRTLDKEKVLVVLNRDETDRQVTLPLPEAARYRVQLATVPNGYAVHAAADTLHLRLPPLTGLVLQQE